MSGPESERREGRAGRPDALADVAGADGLGGAATAASSADAFRLRGEPPRVMRLSRKALAVLGAAAGLGIGGSLLYGLQTRSPPPPRNLYEVQNRNTAAAVAGSPEDYSQVPKLGAPLPGDLGRPILSAQANGQSVPVPPMGQQGASQPNPRVTAAEQARQRMLQEKESARSSKLFLAGAATADHIDPDIASNAAPAIVTSAGAMPTDDGRPSAQSAKRAFLQNRGNRDVVSHERLSPVVSPYIIQAGSIIPAALITGIRSDLPGPITAQVTQNVYDSLTGRILLIPQGSRLIGEYDSDVSAGQTRVLLAWDRLILPDGRSMLLDRLPGADAAGMVGLADRTDYHWGNMLKAALISTMLGTGTELVADGDDELVRALRYGSQDTINQTGRQLVQREVNVSPTLTIRPGFALRVIVTRDMVMEPVDEGETR